GPPLRRTQGSGGDRKRAAARRSPPPRWDPPRRRHYNRARRLQIAPRRAPAGEAPAGPKNGMTTLTTRCCIAGGGPAGMMLGLLLARAGVEVLVLEKHADFLRDFRGDTIHPSTLEVMHELGLLERFLALPHDELQELGAQVGGATFRVADFTRLPTHYKFIAFMPQWDFLDFVAREAARYPAFSIRMRAEVTGLLEDGGAVIGVRAET